MSVGAGVNERLAALTAAGTSVWLDQTRRSIITSGELERLERELSLRGVTSNPAIFEKAILGSTDYDEQIAELAEQGMDARAIYDEIAILDVQLACDVLRGLWEEADHGDGFVSLEVEPGFAHDTDATIKQAHEYWDRVDRPNLMIKIPGTEAGVPAIEETIAAGINVNVTLLFSVESYSAIAEAYIRGMERRHEAGESLDIHSVASFFVSRVDTEVDKRLAGLGREDLRGVAAIANARAAYQRFKELFRGERFAADSRVSGHHPRHRALEKRHNIVGRLAGPHLVEPDALPPGGCGRPRRHRIVVTRNAACPLPERRRRVEQPRHAPRQRHS